MIAEALRDLERPEVWREDVQKERADALRQLRDLAPKSPKAVASLTKVAKSKDPVLAQIAVETLGRIGPSAAASLDDLLTLVAPANLDPAQPHSEELRNATLSAIAEIAPADDRVVEILFKELRTTLGRARNALEVLRSHSASYDRSIQKRAILEMEVVPRIAPELIRFAGLIEPESESTITFLSECLGRDDPLQRYSVAEVLFEQPIHRAELVAGLCHVLEDLRPKQPPAALRANLPRHWDEMKLIAIGALGKIGAPARGAIPVLESFISYPSYPVRLESAVAICRITGEFPQAANFLRGLFEREKGSLWLWPDTHTTNIAVECPATIPLLTELLKDRDKHIRQCALIALAASGRNAAQAAPEVKLLFTDAAEGVRRQATNTLGAITQPAK